MPKAKGRGSKDIGKMISGSTQQKIKKFGFGSNLVDFQTQEPTDRDKIIGGLTPVDESLKYTGQFDPAYNMWNKGEWKGGDDGRRYTIDRDTTGRHLGRDNKGRRKYQRKMSDPYVPQQTAAQDSYYDSTSLLLNGKSSLTDLSPVAATVRNGYNYYRAVEFRNINDAEEVGKAQKFTDYYYLDGMGKRLEITDYTSQNNFGSEFFTFEMWIRPERKNIFNVFNNGGLTQVTSHNTHTLLDMRPEGEGRLPSKTYNNCPYIILRDIVNNEQGEIEFSFIKTATSTFFARTGDGVIWDEWNHIVIQRYNTDVSIYINGVKKVTEQNVNGVLRSSGKFFIGHDVGSGSNIRTFSSGFKGAIALVRNTPGVARYAFDETFDPETTIAGFKIPPLNPTTIAGCTMWFDANDRTSIKDGPYGVEFWGDKTGNGNNLVQTDIGARPHLEYNESFEKPTMRFSGTRDTSRDDSREPSIQNGDYLECETDVFNIPDDYRNIGKAARTSIFIVFKTLSGLEVEQTSSSGRERDPIVIGYQHTILSLLNTGTIPIFTKEGDDSDYFNFPNWEFSDTVRRYGSRPVDFYRIDRRSDYQTIPSRRTKSTTMRTSYVDKYTVVEMEWGGDENDTMRGDPDYFRDFEKIKWGPYYMRMGRVNRDPHTYDKFVVGSCLETIERGASPRVKVRNGMVGNVAEILVYKGGISEKDKVKIKNYLVSKWEINLT